MNIIDRNSYIVSHAPEWRVVMYNADSKNGMDMTLAKYLTHLPKWNPVESTTTLDGTGEKIGPIKYAGLDCIRYGHVFIRKGGTVDPDNRYGSEVYVAPNKEFPKEACQIDGKFCRDPSLPGIHVLVRVHAESAPKVSGQNLSSAMSTFFSRSLVLETKSVESKEFPASYFDYPAKIIKVGRECDVLNHMSVADQNELFDVLAK